MGLQDIFLMMSAIYVAPHLPKSVAVVISLVVLVLSFVA